MRANSRSSSRSELQHSRHASWRTGESLSSGSGLLVDKRVPGDPLYVVEREACLVILWVFEAFPGQRTKGIRLRISSTFCFHFDKRSCQI